MTDVVTMLRKVENLRLGDPMPEEWGPGNWGPPLSKMCGDAADEIERLRHELNAAQNINWRYAARACNIDTTIAPQPWGSPYAMNPENWK